MESLLISKPVQVLSTVNQVYLQTESSLQLKAGNKLDAGEIVLFPQNSELIVVDEEGFLQHFKNFNGKITTTNEQDIENQGLDADIAAIQAQIESGDGDIDSPSTESGALSNEGFSIVNVDRIGDETLAVAGYETQGLSQNTAVQDIDNGIDGIGFTGSSNNLVDQNEAVVVNEDSLITGNVLANSSSSDGTPQITGFTVNGVNYNAGETANLTEGQLTLNADGSYTFVPAADYNGAVPIVTYIVEDGLNTDTSTLTISVIPQPENDLTDDDETAITNEDTAINGQLLTNASSSDGTPQITGFTVNGVNYNAGETATLAEGQLTLNADGSYTFIPAAGYNGAVPVVTYTVEDGLNTDTSTLTISVTAQPENDLTDGDETATTNENTSTSGNVLTNAASSDGTPQITSFTVNGVNYNAGDTATLTEGQLTLNADGSYTFVPAADYNGAVPVVTYTIEDGLNTDTSTLTISVTAQPENDLTDGDENCYHQ